MPSLFNYCPNCKTPEPDFLNDKEFICRFCGWNYFHNVAAAAAVFIVADGLPAAGDRAAGRLLFIRRNRNPGKGLLDLPGGFVDPAESAETAIRREIKEELGAALRDLRYFGSYPNRYFYNEVWYNTCDLYFTAGLESGALMLNTEEIAGIEYISPEEYAAPGFPENIAFDSAKAALRDFAAGQYPADGLNRQNSC